MPASEEKGVAGKAGEVIIEFIPMGASVKVSAVHVATGTEVSIVGPAHAARADLERAALSKLDYVMKKSPPDKGPGVIC